MTGGQDAAGAVPVPELTRQLEAEGCARILVLTDEPEKYHAGARWAPGVEVWHRDRLDEAQRILREAPGVTALIYDQRCAAEKRPAPEARQAPRPGPARGHQRARVRGMRRLRRQVELPVRPAGRDGVRPQDPDPPVVLQQGLLVPPGRLPVLPHGRAGGRAAPAAAQAATRSTGACRSPSCASARTASLFLMGIGGTGVVTVNQILGTAALLDGKHVAGLDQTGLSQKGGPVVSHLRIGETAAEIAGKVGVAEADLLPRLRPARRDLGAEPPARAARPDDRRRVDHPGSDGRDGGLDRRRVPRPRRARRRDQPGDPQGRERVRRRSRPGEALFGDHMAANMILLGAAYQAGAIPVRAAAIEEAIAINGVQVEMNTQAFRVGRLLVADPGWVADDRADAGPAPSTRARELGPEAQALIDSVGASGELRRLLEVRVPELIAYQDAELRAALRRLRPEGRRGGAGGGAGRDAARRGGGAPSLQADGLQGRVRGGAAPPPARGPRVDPGGDGRGPGALPAPPADPPGARA